VIQKVRAALGWIAVGALVLFIILNRATVPVNFWFAAEIKAPIALIVMGSAGMGAVAVYMLQAYRRSKEKK